MDGRDGRTGAHLGGGGDLERGRRAERGQTGLGLRGMAARRWSAGRTLARDSPAWGSEWSGAAGAGPAAVRQRRDAGRATARIGTRRRVGRLRPPGCASERGGGSGGGKGAGVKSAGESGSRGGGSRERDG
jgi:hypothetical protein